MRTSVLFCAALTLTGLCACSATPSDRSGFYAYTDAQGNLITVQQQGHSGEAPEEVAESEKKTKVEKASNWSEVDPSDYRSDAEVQAELEARERSRFVTYVDGEGHLVTAPLDAKAMKEAAGRRPQPYEDLPGSERAYGQSWSAIAETCCQDSLEDGITLAPGSQRVFDFAGAVAWIEPKGRHPAVVLELDDKLAGIQVQTFLRPKGYLHPQALFLNADGRPILRIDSLFTRKYPETWARQAMLEGTLPVIPEAHWLVLYLEYALPGPDGKPEVAHADTLWRDAEAPLAVTGELVVTGRSGPNGS